MTDAAIISVPEAIELMRSRGFQIGTEFFTEGIRQGVFPFAFAVKGNSWRYFISRKKLYEFLADWVGVEDW